MSRTQKIALAAAAALAAVSVGAAAVQLVDRDAEATDRSAPSAAGVEETATAPLTQAPVTSTTAPCAGCETTTIQRNQGSSTTNPSSATPVPQQAKKKRAKKKPQPTPSQGEALLEQADRRDEVFFGGSQPAAPTATE